MRAVQQALAAAVAATFLVAAGATAATAAPPVRYYERPYVTGACPIGTHSVTVKRTRKYPVATANGTIRLVTVPKGDVLCKRDGRTNEETGLPEGVIPYIPPDAINLVSVTCTPLGNDRFRATATWELVGGQFYQFSREPGQPGVYGRPGGTVTTTQRVTLVSIGGTDFATEGGMITFLGTQTAIGDEGTHIGKNRHTVTAHGFFSRC